MSNPSVPGNSAPKHELSRSLQGRHLTMISIGGIIGAGLFVGSSVAISSVGPAVILSYALTGVLFLLVMRSLGEMAIVLVEQYLDFARELGDQFAVLDRGTVVYSCKRADLDEAALKRALAI